MPQADPMICRSCGASIFMAKTATGKTCPYNAAKVKDDKAAKVYAYAMDLAGTMIRVAPGEEGHQSHFGTCNAPASWSKKAAPAATEPATPPTAPAPPTFAEAAKKHPGLPSTAAAEDI